MGISSAGRALVVDSQSFLLHQCLVDAVRNGYGEQNIGAINCWMMMGVLAGYTLVLATIGVVIVRFGKVWDDARSILLLLLLLFLAVFLGCHGHGWPGVRWFKVQSSRKDRSIDGEAACPRRLNFEPPDPGGARRVGLARFIRATAANGRGHQKNGLTFHLDHIPTGFTPVDSGLCTTRGFGLL